MKMTKTISYDKESDILFMHKGFSKNEKFKTNIDIGDLILDVSTKKRIRGIEIINATEFFKVFNITKNVFKNLKDARFTARFNGNSILLSIAFLTAKEEIPAKIAVPLTV